MNETLQAGLTAIQNQPTPKPFKVEPHSMGGPLPGINLDKANQLAGELEDEELVRKMQLPTPTC